VVVGNTLGAAELLRKYLESDAGSDLLNEMVKMAAELLMDAEVDVLCGAGYAERSEARVNSRNGHRKRRWDTRAGTVELEIPKLRRGSYFPGLLEPRRRAEQALTSVVCQTYVEGVSTRWVDDLVRAMGIEGISKSQVSELAKHRDAKVAEFRNRPLDAGPYTYVWLDALFHKVREGGRVASVATVIATGVNADGHREVLGVDCFTTEDGTGWTAFLRGLVARGLKGVALVVSDAHEGLKHAIAAVLPGATWQRSRTHAMRNLLTRVPKAAQAMVATLVRTVFAQSDGTQVHAQFARVVDQLESQFPAAAEFLLEAEDDLLAFSTFPVEHWRHAC
jgi:putative transposase